MSFKVVKLKRFGDQQYHYIVPFIPVGFVVYASDDVNLSDIYGGTWEREDDGRTIVCINTEDPLFSELGKVGGSELMQLHQHGLTSPTGSGHIHKYNHNHRANIFRTNAETSTSYGLTQSSSWVNLVVVSSSTGSITTGTQGIMTTGTSTIELLNYGKGNSQNVQPSRVVYRYRKIAY